MKWGVYNVLFLLTFPFLLPGFLLRMLRRGGYAARMGDRFALYPDSIRAAFRLPVNEPRPVWIHAVSVGEVQVAGQLMREWRAIEPTVRFCFSTTSSTGWKMAEKEVTDRDVLIYNPLDFPSYVKSALKTVRPRAIVLTESEIWPNFILKAKKYGIPLFLINARVSDRSAPRYKLAKCFFGDVFKSFAAIFAQSNLDAGRLIAAGAPVDRVQVTGSFKFDVAHRNEAKERELRQWIGEGRILLGGSTWPGEDEVLLGIFKRLNEPNLKLVLAPRHFEKADAVEANIRKAGLDCVRRSRGEKGTKGVYLADTTGELMGLYGISDVVFVGKSLCAHGSQNMIEPCLCGKPTLVGPYTENFRPVMSDLLESRAIVQVADAKELEEQVKQLLKDDGGLGARAAEAVVRRRGVVAKCVAAIRGTLICALVAAVVAGCSKKEEPKPAEEAYVFEPICIASAYTALLEKPNASSVLCLGPEAQKVGAYLAHAGVVPEKQPKELVDLVVIDCAEMTPESCAKASQLAKEDGLLVWLLNVEGLSKKEMKRRFESFNLPEAHLWMPGETRWVLIGRKASKKVALGDMLNIFTREWTFKDLSDAHCDTLPNLFANYVGTREETMPACDIGNTDEIIQPAFFLTKEVPALSWIDAEDVDADIRQGILTEMRSMQVVRRLAVEGNMEASAGKEKEAVDKWSRAAKRNPNDLFILERMDRLDRNARGFLEVGKVLMAMKCYETIVLVVPQNSSAVHNFGMCLKKIGKLDLAEKVLKSAEEKAARVDAESTKK